MDHELAFMLINLLVIPAWLLLIVAPNWRLTTSVVHAVFVPLILVLIYIYYISWALFFGGGAEGGGFGGLNEVMTTFTSPVGMLAGWVHYLAFDLFVGMWIARDASRRGVRHVWIVPCLILTWLFGPVGLGLYFLVRAMQKKGGWSLDESKAGA